MIGGWAFRRELRQWSRAGQRLAFWWRDDDAREPGPALDRLLRLAARYEAPLTLAVIPDGDRSDLAARLTHERLASVIQHGVDHCNISPAGAPYAEFAAGCETATMTERLVAARSRLLALPRFLPVFAPPWNVVHPDLTPALRTGGFAALSAFGENTARAAGLGRIDVHLDLLRWNGGPRFRGETAFLARAARLARDRRRAGRWDQPIGLLTHHLDHDEAAWGFLDAFLALTARSEAVQWRGLADLTASDLYGLQFRAAS